MNGCGLNKHDVEIYAFLQSALWLVLCIVLNCLRGFLLLVLCTSAYSFGMLLCSWLFLYLDFLVILSVMKLLSAPTLPSEPPRPAICWTPLGNSTTPRSLSGSCGRVLGLLVCFTACAAIHPPCTPWHWTCSTAWFGGALAISRGFTSPQASGNKLP